MKKSTEDKIVRLVNNSVANLFKGYNVVAGATTAVVHIVKPATKPITKNLVKGAYVLNNYIGRASDAINNKLDKYVQ